MDGVRSGQSSPPRDGSSGLLTVAKGHARRHWRLLAGVVVVALLAGGGVGTWLGLRSTSHFVGTKPLRSAFAKGDGTEAGGRPSWALDAYDELRFIPSAPFQLGIVLTNNASQPVTLTDVRAVLPHGSVIRQLGTALAAWDPRPCTTPSCPAPGGGITQPRSDGALRPKALTVAPGTGAAVQLNFRFIGCPQARHASLQNVSGIEVSYRDPAGTVVRQRVGLAYSTLQINTPRPCSR
jgi:hypothetical protein